MKKKAMRRVAKKEVQKKLTENVRMERKPIRSRTRMEGGAVLKVSRSGMRRIKMGRMRTSMREGGEVEGGDEGD